MILRKYQFLLYSNIVDDYGQGRPS